MANTPNVLQYNIFQCYEFGTNARFLLSEELRDQDLLLEEIDTLDLDCWENFVQSFKDFFQMIFDCLCSLFLQKDAIDLIADELSTRQISLEGVIDKLLELSDYLQNHIHEITNNQARKANNLIASTLEDRCRQYTVSDLEEIRRKKADAGILEENTTFILNPSILPSDYSAHQTIQRLVSIRANKKNIQISLVDAPNFIEKNPKCVFIRQAQDYILRSYKIHEISHYKDALASTLASRISPDSESCMQEDCVRIERGRAAYRRVLEKNQNAAKK